MLDKEVECCPHCGQAIAPKIVTFNHNHELDEVQGTVSDGFHVISLTKQETRLFSALVSAKDRVASKSFIYDAVYGIESERDQKIIDVVVCKIRRKLAYTQIHIETIWGRGYRLTIKPSKAA